MWDFTVFKNDDSHSIASSQFDTVTIKMQHLSMMMMLLFCTNDLLAGLLGP